MSNVFEAIQGWWTTLDPFWYSVVLIAAILVAIGAAAVMVLWLYGRSRPRKHRHHHRHHHHHHKEGAEEQGGAPTEPPGAPVNQVQSQAGELPEEGEKGVRRRRRRRRREHRPRNPTLAETGGLPPIRSGEPPPGP